MLSLITGTIRFQLIKLKKQITDNTTLISGGSTSLGGVDLISQKVFIKSICKSRLPNRSVNLSFIITIAKNELTDLRGN